MNYSRWRNLKQRLHQHLHAPLEKPDALLRRQPGVVVLLPEQPHVDGQVGPLHTPGGTLPLTHAN